MMVRFLDVLANPGSEAAPALLVFQSEHLDALATVLVVPCRPLDKADDLGRLTPIIRVACVRYRAIMPEMAAIRRTTLKGSWLGNAKDDRDALMAALDLLVSGF
jgi:hypothetical protein